MTVPRERTPESIGTVGDITALASASTVLCVGVGSQVLVFDVRSGRKLAERRAFESGVRVHGIRVAELGIPNDADGVGGDGDGSTSSFLLVAHGDRGAASYLVSLSREAGGASSATLEETWRCSAPAWTLDAVPTVDASSPSTSSSAVVAVGAADGSVSLHRVPASPSGPSAPLLDTRCSERCLFYSMALLAKGKSGDEKGGAISGGDGREREWWVAGGSVFLDVLVWRLPPTRKDPKDVAGCPVLFRLAGHEGSIHRVAWAPVPPRFPRPPSPSPPSISPSSLLLASASDDRTLRLWSVPATAGAGGEALAGPVFRGHGSRLWDIAFVPSARSTSTSSSSPPAGDGDDGGGASTSPSPFARSLSSSGDYPPSHVLSTSEDCTARLWSVFGSDSSSPVATLRGHRGRGIWRAAVVASSSSPLPLVATAGADGDVKVWRLSDHVTWASASGGPVGAGCRVLRSPFEAEAPSPRPSEAVAVRTLHAAGPGVLLVGTSDGAVWRVDLGVGRRRRKEATAASTSPLGDGDDAETEDSWSLVFRSPGAGSVLSLSAVACARHGFEFDSNESTGDGCSSPCSCDEARSSRQITRARPLLVLASYGRGEAALGCDCSRFLPGAASGGAPPPPLARWTASPPTSPPDSLPSSPSSAAVHAPLLKCYLPVELGGRVAVTASSLGDVRVWKLFPRKKKENDDDNEGATPPPPPPLLLASSPPRRARRRRDSLSVTCLACCGARGKLFAGDSDGGVSVYSLPDSLSDGDDGGGGTTAAAALPVAARARTPDGEAATCLRLLRSSPYPGDEGKSGAECCGELRVGDGAGRTTTFRLEGPSTDGSDSSPPTPPWRLSAVGGERFPFPIVSTDEPRHPDPSVGRRERFASGFSGETWIAVSFPKSGGSRPDDGDGDDGEGMSEVARAETGGWRRPLALVPGGGEAGRASGGGALVARELRGGGGKIEAASRADVAAGHGLEVHASVALPCPGSPSSAVLTASEDGELRWLLVRGGGGGGGGPSLASSGRARALADGSALRALASVPFPGSPPPPSDFLVFASGARAYVTAWRAWWSGGDEEDGGQGTARELRTSWLAASSCGVRSGKAARTASSQAGKAEASPRALDAAAFAISEGGEGERDGVVAVLVANSLGDVEAVAFDASRGEFVGEGVGRPPARLACHDGPALCVTHVPLSLSDGRDPSSPRRSRLSRGGLAFSGSTDGCVAVWAGSDVAEALLSAPQPSVQQKSEPRRPAPPPAAAVVSPVAVLPSLHRSGVNAVAASQLPFETPLGSASVLLVTGGDDGALRATVLSADAADDGDPTRPVVSASASSAVDGAHGCCAVRGAWCEPVFSLSGGDEASAEVVTLGLDQTLRGWTVGVSCRSREEEAEEERNERRRKGETPDPSFSVSLRARWAVPVQVPFPEAMSVLPEKGLISVSGRGTQAFSWK